MISYSRASNYTCDFLFPPRFFFFLRQPGRRLLFISSVLFFQPVCRSASLHDRLCTPVSPKWSIPARPTPDFNGYSFIHETSPLFSFLLMSAFATTALYNTLHATLFTSFTQPKTGLPSDWFPTPKACIVLYLPQMLIDMHHHWGRCARRLKIHLPVLPAPVPNSIKCYSSSAQ